MNFPTHILIVDDEVHIRRFLGLLVKKLGALVVTEASNGDEAVELFSQHRPGLVLLDINMPGRSGIETLQEIRTQDIDVPVVMMTSLTSRQIIEETVASGADNFIRKDTPPQEIARILAELFTPATQEPAVPQNTGEGI